MRIVKSFGWGSAIHVLKYKHKLYIDMSIYNIRSSFIHSQWNCIVYLDFNTLTRIDMNSLILRGEVERCQGAVSSGKSV